MPASSVYKILTVLTLFSGLIALTVSGYSHQAQAGPAGLSATPGPGAGLAHAQGEEAPLGRIQGTPSHPGSNRPPVAGVHAAAAVPTLRASFKGIGMEANSMGVIKSPPDTHAAVGPDRLVAVTNGHVAIYDKTGVLLAGGDGTTGPGAVDLVTFCGGSNCFDPKIIYDQYAGRFVAVALEGRSSPESRLHLMVSKTAAPANLGNDWVHISQPAGLSIGTTTGWFDYPGLGVSPEAVVVTGNMFLDGFPFALGTRIRILDKADLYDGDNTAAYTDLDRDLSSGGFTQQPAHHFGNPPANTFYLIQSWDRDQIRVSAIADILGTPALSSVVLATSDQGDCNAVRSAPQKGTSVGLDTICGRMMDAVWRDGSLWGVLTGADGGASKAMIHFFEVATTGFPGSAPTLVQQGVVDGGTDEFTFMPAVAVDACGNIALTYTQSSLIRFPEMRYTGRRSTDPPGALQAPGVVIASPDFYDDFTMVDRWGDYAFAGIDPADGAFWMANEYAAVPATGPDSGRWGTWHASFDFGCGINLPTATPTVIPTVTPTPAVQIKLPLVVQDASIP